MRIKLFLPVVAICCAFALFAGACSSTEDSKNKDAEATTTVKAEKETTTTTAAPTETLAALLVADPQLSEFSGLATEAGLNAMLTDGGPFTVLAPTNAAIDTVPAATMTALEQDPRGALANVLKLHILNGNVTWDDLSEKNGQCVATLGGNVKVTVEGEEARITAGRFESSLRLLPADEFPRLVASGRHALDERCREDV